MQRLELLESERETQHGNAAKQNAQPQEFAMTPKCQEEEIRAPVNEVFQLLIVEPEASPKDPFMVSVPMNAVGARLRAIINRHGETIHMGGRMVYD